MAFLCLYLKQFYPINEYKKAIPLSTIFSTILIIFTSCEDKKDSLIEIEPNSNIVLIGNNL